MASFTDEEVPFKRINNHQALTDRQVMELPRLMDFMRAFSHCFERDEVRQCYYFY